MKNVLVILVVSVFLLSGCAFHSGLSNNFNNNVTMVQLSQNNYKVIDYITGKSSCTYVFGLGGLGKSALVEKAKSEMYKKANLTGSARAVANIAVDTKLTTIFFVQVIEVTASGHVVEFN